MVTEHKRTLEHLVDLRNMVQHHAVMDGVPIANPRTDTVTALEEIAAQVERHPPIGDFAHSPKVLTATESLKSAAEKVVKDSLSQLPVYNGSEYVGLFTTNAMARWLGSNISDRDGLLLAENVTVEDVMGHAEPHENPAFVKPTLGALLACDKLSSPGPDAVVALLVTTDGTQKGKLQGIVTRFDVPEILKKISVSLA